MRNTVAYIGVGSNIRPEENIQEALRILSQHVSITAISTFYETEPIQRTEQHPFWNGVVQIRTSCTLHDLKVQILREIEKRLGRIRTVDLYASRTIDLDILLFGETVLQEEDLCVPGPEIRSRWFVSVPLWELDPDLVLPDTQTSLQTIVADFQPLQKKPLQEFSDLLKKGLFHE
jgi:2-amino-4-hydroxy-6-hydroxymethyldihydropteridine diphosphokinase